MVKHWPSTLIRSVVQVSKQLFMSMITLNLHVQVAQLCTSSIPSSSLVFNLTALAFWTVQMGLQSGLTQVKPVQGCAPQTNNFLGEWDSPAHRSDNVLSSVSSLSSTTKKVARLHFNKLHISWRVKWDLYLHWNLALLSEDPSPPPELLLVSLSPFYVK